MAGWHEKYGPQGFLVVGIHSPEFAWEHDLDKVRKACKRLGVEFPVALDNDFATWKRYGTRSFLAPIPGRWMNVDSSTPGCSLGYSFRRRCISLSISA